ncbi:ABC transporter permease [Streptomyces decoyicus]|uniref:ABC transporter permease n=1 Tax=Streptomyces decoyicus TaxID=249567 RepID=UPI002E2FD52E|nr:ABC transporter permease [Streptomyces decoyicus]
MSLTIPATEHRSAPYPGPVFPQLLRSEWAKLRTVRATVCCLLATAAVAVGISVIMATVIDKEGPQPIAQMVINSHIGFGVGQLAVVVLAVTTIGSEYSTGTIRTSLTAVPRRGPWLMAKALVTAALVLVTGVLLSIVCFTVEYSSAPAVAGSVTDPSVVRAVLGGGLYLSALAVLALAVGAVLRSTVGGIVVMFTLLFVVPTLAATPVLSGLGHFLPGSLVPGSAGWAIMQPGPMLGGLGPWAGFGVLCAWAAAAMAGALYLLDKRDA